MTPLQKVDPVINSSKYGITIYILFNNILVNKILTRVYVYSEIKKKTFFDSSPSPEASSSPGNLN